MSYAAYLRGHVPDFVLCALAALGLGLNVVQGFHIPDAAAENVALVAAAVIVPMVVLLLVGYSKRTLVVGVPLIVVGVAAYVLVLSLFTDTAVFAETYDNDVLVFVVLLPVSFAVYLLARTQVGIAVLFTAGCLACAAMQFLYGKNLVAATAVFMVSCCALFLLKNSLEPRVDEGGLFAEGLEEGSRGPALQDSSLAAAGPSAQGGKGAKQGLVLCLPRLVMSVGLAVVATLVAAAVFLLVVAPLNPPAHELKLITERYSLEEVHVSGVLSFLHQRDQDKESQTPDDETRHTNQTDDEQQNTDGDAGSQNQSESQDQGEGQNDENGAQHDAIGASVLEGPVSAVRFLRDHWWIVLIVLALMLLAWALVVAGRRMARKRRLERWRARGPRAEYEALFRHICQILERTGLIDIGSKTPLELGESSAESMRRLEGCYSPKPGKAANGASSVGAMPVSTGNDVVADDAGIGVSAASASAADAATNIGTPAVDAASVSVAAVEPSTAFARLAAGFARVSYGGEEPANCDLADAEEYVELLPKRLPRTIGRLRYLRHFFRV